MAINATLKLIRIMKIRFKGKTYEIKISEHENGTIQVKINQDDYFFSAGENGEIFALKDFQNKDDDYKNGFEETEAGSEKVISPLAGTVLKIFVSKGDKVKKNQTLISVFSMKMENEIISPRTAVIKEIKVKKGESVDSEQILIILK